MLTPKNDVSVPICVSGAVQRTQIDFCMDGVPYLLITQAGTFRVKPRTDEIGETLDGAAGTKMLVGVCGYLKQGAECTHLDAYWAGHPETLEAIGSA